MSIGTDMNEVDEVKYIMEHGREQVGCGGLCNRGNEATREYVKISAVAELRKPVPSSRKMRKKCCFETVYFL